MGYIKWKQEKPDPDRWFPPWCIDAFPYITAASVVQIAVRAIVGTALVIGANRGESETDHAFQTLVSPAASHIHKIFIEPIPPVFRRLQQNVQSVANTTTLELAVSNQSGTLPMFCLGFDPAQSGVLDSSGPYGLPKFSRELRMSASRSGSARRDGRGWWTEVCSLSKERLLDNRSDVAEDFINWRDRKHEDAAALLSRFVQNVSVRVVTFDELLSLLPDGGAVPIIDRTAVRHLQIDVEGFDDALISSLPLVERRDASRSGIGWRAARADGFRPWSIVFEHMLLTRARLADAGERLRSFGYEVCLEGQNAVAFEPSLRAFRKLPNVTRPKQPGDLMVSPKTLEEATRKLQLVSSILYSLKDASPASSPRLVEAALAVMGTCVYKNCA